MRAMIMASITATALVVGMTAAVAQQPGQGPVAQQCQSDIAKFCAGKEHAGREVRTCLEQKKSQLTDACKNALSNTGPGKGAGKGAGKG